MHQYLYPLTAALYIVGNYPQWRDGATILNRDAIAILTWLSSLNSTDLPGELTAAAPVQQRSDFIWVPSGASDLTARTKALFTMGSIIAEAYKVYQGKQIEYHVANIAREISISNDLQIMGGGGEGGFAQIVRDFVVLKVREYSNDGNEHRFFVFHPDTAWKGAFVRLEETQGPLPTQFAGIGHDLFVLCRWMLCVRVALIEAMGDDGKNIHFHLLVPTYEPLVIPRPFEFLPALFPLTVEGAVSRGQNLVWLRIFRCPAGLLRNVGAIPPPSHVRAEAKAALASTATWSITGPTLITLGSLVCPATAPLVVALPLGLGLIGTALGVSVKTGLVVKDRCLDEELPAILG